ncbi:forkhead box protein J3-like isoform X1 [Centruroides vittatus]|uniref:forkhead box protein J3-like isoform X1 n=1 Tax=Centruroides vittatus TaxID=120091 RepID=UPI00350F287A
MNSVKCGKKMVKRRLFEECCSEKKLKLTKSKNNAKSVSNSLLKDLDLDNYFGFGFLSDSSDEDTKRNFKDDGNDCELTLTKENLAWLLNLQVGTLFNEKKTIYHDHSYEKSRDHYHSTTEEYLCLTVKPEKPPYTYKELIELALKERSQLTVSEIYQWIGEHFPFYRNSDGRWKKSIRYNLSINPHFEKGEKSDRGGHLWKIVPIDFTTNNQIFAHNTHKERKRRRKSHNPDSFYNYKTTFSEVSNDIHLDAISNKRNLLHFDHQDSPIKRTKGILYGQQEEKVHVEAIPYTDVFDQSYCSSNLDYQWPQIENIDFQNVLTNQIYLTDVGQECNTISDFSYQFHPI